LSVRSALASLRGLSSRYRGGSNVRRPGWVQGATDGSRLPTVSTTVKLSTNATNSNTNSFNKDHPVPLRATQDHQSTTKRPVKFPITPHALKLLPARRVRRPDTVSS
jgi:hypothetical protein